MGQFNERIEALSEKDQEMRYQRLADAALRHYDLGKVTPRFIQYNGGVSYRLVGADDRPLYLLKIAEAAGESGGVPPERTELVMEWLDVLAESGEIVVQEPVPSKEGTLVAEVHFSDLDAPFYVTVQRWVEGRHIRDAFSVEEAYRIGAMIATLHELSSRWTPGNVGAAEIYDVAWLFGCLTTLSRVVTAGILTPEEWQTVEAGMEQVAKTMRVLGTGPDIWGLIHGDLHHQNLLFDGKRVFPIDFGDVILGYFPHDLGVIFYHVMYLDDVAVRRAIRDGYLSVRPVPDVALWAEAFLCAAALGNLAFQVTLARERASEHFSRNVREFARVFCANLVKGASFVLDGN